MTVNQLPVDIGVFMQYLGRMTALLDRYDGWYGVFLRRDPDGMAACLDGSEIPPWDVVESLLQDLAPTHGPEAVARETVRARALHTAAAAAYDARPGGREALRDRLALMLREQAYAADRLPGAAPAELAWIQDDLARATARCAELRARIAALGPEVPRGWFSERAVARPRDPAEGEDGPSVRGGPARPGASGEPGPPGGSGGPAADPAPRVPAPRPAARRIARGARFAGIEADAAEAEDGGPLLPPVAAAAPTGARFGSGWHTRRQPEHARGKGEQRQERADDRDQRRSVREAVVRLVRLRARGRTGEAHAVLCEAAAGPAALLPLFAGELHRAGLGADWATLLWEAASLPPDRLAAAADALAAAGQGADCHRLLRQGVSRPAEQIADAVLALGDAGREREAAALLSAFVRVRTPEDAAHLAAHAPARLGPQLLAAAGAVSEGRRRDVVHAFRVARIATER
ncbi:hypothetical protein [Streptomyces melanogenes]|uniref:hypothetical protein n=1 Tax=Streptomyces melanogenes TaxID=67326 RepID=UPI00167D011A|nr:hypothetical protein [Streptomyces melanogenes]GGP58882.1 hypothetical protein GCM10010278_39840 [Streptomyces melanogenes]